MWILTISLAFASASQSSLDSRSFQFWSTEQLSTHAVVTQDISDKIDTLVFLVEQSTDIDLS